MLIRCPLCGVVVPEEDRDVPSRPGEMIVAQIECRGCVKVFTICEERKMLRIREGPMDDLLGRR